MDIIPRMPDNNNKVSSTMLRSREVGRYATIVVTIRDRSDITIVEMSSLSAYRSFASTKIAWDYVVINHEAERTFFSVRVQ